MTDVYEQCHFKIVLIPAVASKMKYKIARVLMLCLFLLQNNKEHISNIEKTYAFPKNKIYIFL